LFFNKGGKTAELHDSLLKEVLGWRRLITERV
jgi:hypothetical protein